MPRPNNPSRALPELTPEQRAEHERAFQEDLARVWSRNNAPPRPRSWPVEPIPFDNIGEPEVPPQPLPNPPARAQVNPVRDRMDQDIEDFRRIVESYRDEQELWVRGEFERRTRNGTPISIRDLRAHYQSVRRPPESDTLGARTASRIRDDILLQVPESYDAVPEPAPKFKYMRGEATPCFFLNYASAEEFSLRLKNTFILYKNSPVFVHHVSNAPSGPVLHLRSDNSGLSWPVPVRENIKNFDTRPFAPGYVKVPSWKKGCGYLHRLPSRVQRQGTCGENTYLAIPGFSTEINPYHIGRFKIAEVVEILADQSEQPYDPALMKDFMAHLNEGSVPSVKLSRNFALFQVTPDRPPQLGYRNRSVGSILKDKIPDLSGLPSSLKDECKRLNLL